jgi:phage-related protein
MLETLDPNKGACSSVGTTKKSKPDAIAISFGEGYKQVVKSGIPSTDRTWNVRLDARTWQEAEYIEDFFQRHEGKDPFAWHPTGHEGYVEGTGEEVYFVVRVTEWDETPEQGDSTSFTANFEQVYGAF